MPGGHLHANEDYRESLKREIFEETGLADLEFVDVLGVNVLGTAYGVCFHAFLSDSNAIQIVLSDEHEDFAW